MVITKLDVKEFKEKESIAWKETELISIIGKAESNIILNCDYSLKATEDLNHFQGWFKAKEYQTQGNLTGELIKISSH